MKFKKFFSIVLLVFIIFLTACTSYNEENSSSNKDNKPTEETKILELNGVEKAKINLDFPAGILNINGNEEKLMKWKYI
ncbi:hypothetical protein [Clostridium sp. Marseille-Q2269]|uniref:hypothetical protein n=1 Tax=Clostridium sp. Marseille-Q2269 TaxID=2942205 RepID=UPI00207401C2|nr:hypothetical protein [Clostridium sp. Marseille-Q2269]